MALIVQLGEHCTGIAEVMGSNPAQSLKIFSGLCSSSVTATLALMTVITQLLLWDKLLSSFFVIKHNQYRTINTLLLWFSSIKQGGAYFEFGQ